MIYWIIIVSALVIIVISALLFVNSRSISSQLTTANYLEEKTAQSNELYKLQYDYNFKLKEVKHDLQKYYEHYDISEEDIEDYSESRAINKIISSAKKRCSDLGIELGIDIDRTAVPNVDELSLVGILGNLIENAIEASSSYGKKISVIVSRNNLRNKPQDNFQNNFQNNESSMEAVWLDGMKSEIEIIIKNTKNPDIKIKELKDRTTKTDKEMHGFGSGIVDKLLESNNGTITRTDNGETFECVVRLAANHYKNK